MEHVESIMGIMILTKKNGKKKSDNFLNEVKYLIHITQINVKNLIMNENNLYNSRHNKLTKLVSRPLLRKRN